MHRLASYNLFTAAAEICDEVFLLLVTPVEVDVDEEDFSLLLLIAAARAFLRWLS